MSFSKEELYQLFNSNVFRQICIELKEEQQSKKEELLSVDFLKEESRIKAIKLQCEIEAIDYLFNNFTDMKEKSKKVDTSRR